MTDAKQCTIVSDRCIDRERHTLSKLAIWPEDVGLVSLAACVYAWKPDFQSQDILGSKDIPLKRDRRPSRRTSGRWSVHRISFITVITDPHAQADFDNTPFDKKVDPVSLRCITGTDNSKGATEFTNFRDKAGDKYRAGGKYDDKRRAGKMVTGDTFHVDFDMSEFDDNKQADVKLKER